MEGPVTSPTFALVRQYRCGDDAAVETLIHADVYRTGSIGEVVELALAELVEERAIALVEWGDMAAPAFGADALEVRLEVPAPTADPSTAADPSTTADPSPAADPDVDASAEERTISITGRGRWLDRGTDVEHALSEQSRVAP